MDGAILYGMYWSGSVCREFRDGDGLSSLSGSRVRLSVSLSMTSVVYATLLIKVKLIMTLHDVTDVTSASLLCLRHMHRAAAHADKRHIQ